MPQEGISHENELDVLKEILKWVKFSGMKEVREILLSVLSDNQTRAAYQLSDGTKGLHEIGKLVDIKGSTLFNLWKRWLKLGLGESIPVKGGERFKRSFDLEDLGIEVTIPESNVPESESSAPNITQMKENKSEDAGD